MGEAKRRKQLDPSYGSKSYCSNNVFKKYIESLESSILYYKQTNGETLIHYFTNKDKGVTFNEIDSCREAFVCFWENGQSWMDGSEMILSAIELNYDAIKGRFRGWCLVGFIKDYHIHLPNTVTIEKGVFTADHVSEWSEFLKKYKRKRF